MAQPTLKTETFALAAGRQIQSHHGSLNHQRAGTTHRVDEIAAGFRQLRPTAPRQQSRRQIFLQWRCPLFRAIAPLMEAVAAQVDAYRQFAAIQACGYRYIRVFGVHGRPLSTGTAQTVHNTILHSLGTILRVSDGFVLTDKVDTKTAIHRNMLLPLQIRHTPQHLVTGGGIHVRQMKDDPVCEPRPQAGTIATFKGAVGPDTCRCVPDRVHAEGTQFVLQQILQALGAGYEKVKV